MTDLLLLPGLLCDEALWAPQQDGLADVADIQVADLTGQDSIGAMAEAALAVAAPRFCLAGLSMGGYVAFEIMRRAPERVLRLALLDTSARADTEEQSRRRRGLIELASKGDFKGVTPRLLPLFLHPDKLNDETLVTAVTAMAARVGQKAFLRQQRAIMGRPDSRSDLEAIDCPTLVVCGRQDALTPLELSNEIAAGIPAANLLLLGDCGHLSTMERPDEVTCALRNWIRE